MKISKKTHRLYRLQQLIFVVLLITIVVLLAKVSVSTNRHFDLTANGRQTLSTTTSDFLHQIKQDINIQVFITTDNQYHDALVAMMSRYKNESSKLKVSFIDPQLSPKLVRKLNIKQQGEIVVSRGDKQEHVQDLSEQSLTNALIRVSKVSSPLLVFIAGHGERSPQQQANFSLSSWAKQLKLKGFRIQTLNLAQQAQLPKDTAVVVIASPQTPWLAGEINVIKNYVDQGGNLLWLAEPDTDTLLAPLAEQLNLDFVKGTVIDPNSAKLGIKDPRFVLITDYANNVVGKATKNVTLLPQAVAIETREAKSDWQQTSLLNSQPNAWDKSATIDETKLSALQFDANTDIPGPLSLGYMLTRTLNDETAHQQRITVIGDGDFLSNRYLGNGGNLNLGVALVNWLSNDDKFIAIPVKTTIDSQLNLGSTQATLIGIGFLFVLPVILLSIGFTLWWYRRRR